MLRANFDIPVYKDTKVASPQLIFQGFSRNWSRICRGQSENEWQSVVLFTADLLFLPKPKQ